MADFRALWVYVRAIVVTFGLVATPATVASKPFLGAPPNLLPLRYALVIGISTYGSQGATAFSNLPNAAGDAKAIVRLLESFGFDDVISAIPSPEEPWVTKLMIMQKLYDLQDAVVAGRQQNPGRDVSLLIYYAGHGFSWGKEHYIAPSDFFVKFSEDIATFGVPVSKVISIVNSIGALTALVILDTCRDTPLKETKSINGELTEVTKITQGEMVAAKNTNFIFSTTATQTAGEGLP